MFRGGIPILTRFHNRTGENLTYAVFPRAVAQGKGYRQKGFAGTGRPDAKDNLVLSIS
jgi:hypothetical protein